MFFNIYNNCRLISWESSMIDDFFEVLFNELNKYLNEKDIKRLMFDENQFLNNLERQLSINANYDSKPEEMLIFTNKSPGLLAVKSHYAVESNFYGNTFIVNRFEKEIKPAGSASLSNQ